MQKEEIFRYLEKEDLSTPKAEVSFFICDLYFNEYCKTTAVGKALSPIMALVEGKMGFQITEKRGPAELVEALFDQYKKDNSLVQKLQSEHLKLKENIDNIWPGEKALAGYSNQELLEIFEEFLEYAKQSIILDAIGEDKGLFIEEKLVPALAVNNSTSNQEIEELIGVLSHPETLAVFNQEKKLFLELCLAYSMKSEDFSSKVQEYLVKYFWFESTFRGNVEIGEEKLIKKINVYLKKHGKDGILSELKELSNGLVKIHHEKERIMQEYNFSKEDLDIIEFIKQTSYWFDLRKALMMEKFYYTYGFVYEIGRRFKLTNEQVVCLRIDQLLDLLKGKKFNLEEIIEKNQKTLIYFNKEGEKIALFGDDFEKAQKILQQRRVKGEGIKGMIASKGDGKEVEGVVRVLDSPKDENFTKDNILVTSMTRVEFVPLMRVAKAIITDEGGIACHAAIVSRELGVPCIIGTQKATTVLKTGDKVKMNMKTGEIIKI